MRSSGGRESRDPMISWLVGWSRLVATRPSVAVAALKLYFRVILYELPHGANGSSTASMLSSVDRAPCSTAALPLYMAVYRLLCDQKGSDVSVLLF